MIGTHTQSQVISPSISPLPWLGDDRSPEEKQVDFLDSYEMTYSADAVALETLTFLASILCEVPSASVGEIVTLYSSDENRSVRPKLAEMAHLINKLAIENLFRVHVILKPELIKRLHAKNRYQQILNECNVQKTMESFLTGVSDDKDADDFFEPGKSLFRMLALKLSPVHLKALIDEYRENNELCTVGSGLTPRDIKRLEKMDASAMYNLLFDVDRVRAFKQQGVHI